MSELDGLIAELRDAAERLRSGDVTGDEAAALVARCSELGARLAGELESLARRARSEPETA